MPRNRDALQRQVNPRAGFAAGLSLGHRLGRSRACRFAGFYGPRKRYAPKRKSRRRWLRWTSAGMASIASAIRWKSARGFRPKNIFKASSICWFKMPMATKSVMGRYITLAKGDSSLKFRQIVTAPRAPFNVTIELRILPLGDGDTHQLIHQKHDFTTYPVDISWTRSGIAADAIPSTRETWLELGPSLNLRNIAALHSRDASQQPVIVSVPKYHQLPMTIRASPASCMPVPSCRDELSTSIRAPTSTTSSTGCGKGGSCWSCCMTMGLKCRGAQITDPFGETCCLAA